MIDAHKTQKTANNFFILTPAYTGCVAYKAEPRLGTSRPITHKGNHRRMQATCKHSLSATILCWGLDNLESIN